MACGTVREPPALDPEGAVNGASPAVQMARLREYASKSRNEWMKTVNISERAGRIQTTSPMNREDFDMAEAFRLGVAPDCCHYGHEILADAPLYGGGWNPPPSEASEFALGDPFSGLNDYDIDVKPGCCSSWNCLTDPFLGVGLFSKICVQPFKTSPHRGRSSDRRHRHRVVRGAPKVRA